MKKFLTIVFFLFSVLASAQSGFKQGYSGGLEVGGRANIGKQSAGGGEFDILTVHGISYGDGSFIGIGTGLEKLLHSEGVSFPLFLEAKYVFFKSDLSPFVSARTGLELTISEHNDICYFINPSVGVNIHKFFFKVNYWFLGGAGNLDGGVTVPYKGHQIGFSFGKSF